MKRKTPIECLVCAVEPELEKKAVEILDLFGVNGKVFTIGEGTADTAIGNLFGFGIMDRKLIFSIVEKEKSTQLLNALDVGLLMQKNKTGIAFTIDVTAISSDMVERLGLKIS